MGWCVLRIVLAEAFLSEFGVNVAVFAAIELASSPVLALGTARLARALVASSARGVLLHGSVSLIAFAAPDVYLLTAGRDLPVTMYIIIVAVLLVSALASALHLRRTMRSDAVENPRSFDNL